MSFFHLTPKKPWGYLRLVLIIVAGIIAAVYFLSPDREKMMKANEAAALNSLRAVSRAQEQYAYKFGCFSSLEQLVKLGYLDAGLLTEERQGYHFQFELVNEGESYKLYAKPLKRGRTGAKEFWQSADGTIRWGRACRDIFYEPGDDPLLRKHSKELHSTIITAHMEEPITRGKNLMYCLTFQLAWDELKSHFKLEEIRLTDELPMVKFLNKGLSDKNDLSDPSYLAMAGVVGEGIIERINKALKKKFGEDAPEISIRTRTEEDVIAYAFLIKRLEFEKHFETLKEPVHFQSAGGSAKVKAFGIEEFDSKDGELENMAKQVSIADYRSDSDFIINLKSKSPVDEIVLAKIPPKETLLETIKSVVKRVKSGGRNSLATGDTLQIPRFNFDIEHTYEELLGKYIILDSGPFGPIYAALQTVRFKLNEKGAMLESSAVIAVLGDGEGERSPRKLIFDRPFLIYLKEKKGKYPYFAIWVDNPELLVKH